MIPDLPAPTQKDSDPEGTPPKLSRMAQAVQQLEIKQLFDPRHPGQISDDLRLLKSSVDRGAKANGQNAKLPRRDVMTKAEIEAKVDSYCRHMIAIGDLPGNPGWQVALAQWGGNSGEYRTFKQWRGFAEHLAERRITKAQMIEILRNWKP